MQGICAVGVHPGHGRKPLYAGAGQYDPPAVEHLAIGTKQGIHPGFNRR